MKKFRDGFIGPILILLLICGAVTGAVAATQAVTEPIILERQAREAEKARAQVLPGADAFTEMALDLPEGVSEAYAADNGAGYTFKSQARGFEGQVVFMIGIDADGRIAGIEMIEHSETPGQGSLVGEADYLAQYVGRDSPYGVDAVSGATNTSDALKAAVAQAYEAYEQIA